MYVKKSYKSKREVREDGLKEGHLCKEHEVEGHDVIGERRTELVVGNENQNKNKNNENGFCVP